VHALKPSILLNVLDRVQWSIQAKQRSRSLKQRCVKMKTQHYSHIAAGWLNNVGWKIDETNIQAQTLNHFGEQATDSMIIYFLVWKIHVYPDIVRHYS